MLETVNELLHDEAIEVHILYFHSMFDVQYSSCWHLVIMCEFICGMYPGTGYCN